MAAVRVLYISYDGLTDPLGASQVLPYVKGIAEAGAEFTLVTFEKPNGAGGRAGREAIEAELARHPIRWKPFRYHKRPSVLATGWDVAMGLTYSLYAWARYRFTIVHARSYVPAVIALALKRFLGIRFVFDMRGFWADERVEGHIWRGKGLLYRIAKWFEKRFFLAADEVITLTHASVPEILSFPYLRERELSISVIPTCADLGVFRILERSRRLQARVGLEGRFTLMYTGSIGSWYMLEEMLAFFRICQKRFRRAHLVILTHSDPGDVWPRVEALGLGRDDVTVASAAHAEVPEWISVADAGLLFIRPIWSKRASNPTKLAEFLGCGVPVIINSGIGDTERIAKEEQVGAVVEGFTDEEYRKAIDQLSVLLADADLRPRCRSVAMRYFSLAEAIGRYRAVYERLAANG